MHGLDEEGAGGSEERAQRADERLGAVVEDGEVGDDDVEGLRIER